MAGATCTASTSYTGYHCHYTYDGNMATQWASNGQGNAGLITITLPGPRFMTSIVVYTRCLHSDQTSSIQAEFDNGETFEIVSVH